MNLVEAEASAPPLAQRLCDRLCAAQAGVAAQHEQLDASLLDGNL